MSTLFAFLHHLAAFTLFSFLTVEFMLLKGDLTLARAKQILVADAIYGASAALVLTLGLLRVIYFEKGLDYYTHSIPFIIKISTFILVGLMSIYPTIEFMSWRSSVKQGQIPKISDGKIRSIRKIMHFELVGLTVILLCAAMMAKGVG